MALKIPVKIDVIGNITKKLDAINNRCNQINTSSSKIGRVMAYWPKTIQESVNKAKKLHNEFKKNNTLVEDMGRKLKSIFAAYGGVMTIRAVIEASDTITGAENRLNYSNGGDTAATEEAMNKMYAASLRSRSNYGDMLSNVGKSMALASDSFQGNVDNAIRFQEVMAKSYAIGGASAAEQSSSMYQMIQALGSGVLQGDELRSVREGAPLAYKAIEEFAQGVLKTDESLKELASDGKITSDIVVAAMMNAGEGIDKAFENTDMTIDQAFTNMKTVALNSFRPVQDTINEFINSEKGKQFLNGINSAIQGVMVVLNGLVSLFVNAATWLVDNWYWVQWIIYAVGIAIMWLAAVAIGKKLYTAILKIATSSALAWLPWLFAIALVIAAIAFLANRAKDGCDFIYNVCYILALAIIGILAIVLIVHTFTSLTIMTTTQMTILFAIAIIAILLMFFIKFTGEIMGGIYVVGAFFKNVWNGMKNIGLALWEVLKATAHNIKAAFVNTWLEVKAKFWDFVSAVLTGVKKVADLANKLLGVFGVEIDVSGLENKIKDAESKAKDSRDKKLDYESLGEAWNSKINTYASFESGWASEAYGSGYNKGIEIQNSINGLFDKAKGGFSGFGDKLGLGNNFDPNTLGKNVGDIDKNTGKMADSMDLAEEDLEYLRKVADMEWKKEFTTASITVDMSNYNTINNQGDLDGWVTLLSDKLYEELGMVADGVYV